MVGMVFAPFKFWRVLGKKGIVLSEGKIEWKCKENKSREAQEDGTRKFAPLCGSCGRVTGSGGRVTGSGGRVTGSGGRVTGSGGRVIWSGGQVIWSGGRVIGSGGRVIGQAVG